MSNTNTHRMLDHNFNLIIVNYLYGLQLIGPHFLTYLLLAILCVFWAI